MAHCWLQKIGYSKEAIARVIATAEPRHSRHRQALISYYRPITKAGTPSMQIQL